MGHQGAVFAPRGSSCTPSQVEEPAPGASERGHHRAGACRWTAGRPAGRGRRPSPASGAAVGRTSEGLREGLPLSLPPLLRAAVVIVSGGDPPARQDMSVSLVSEQQTLSRVH